MKLISKIILSIVIFLMAYDSALSQTSEIYLIISKKNGEIVSKTENGEKTVHFEIGGIETQQQADAFKEKFTTLRGVVSIIIESDPAYKKWIATAIFYKYANKKYFQNLFTWCGVAYLIIDNIKYNTEDLSSLKTK